jgi:zinc protease
LAAGKTRSFYVVRFACDPANVARAREIIIRNLEEMQTELVSAAELDQARALALHEILLAEAGAERIAKKLLRRAMTTLPHDEAIQAARRYASLTAEEIRTAYARWIQPRSLAEVVEAPTSP